MRRFLALLFGFTLCIFIMGQQAESGGGGIVFGSEIGIGVQAPKGWIFDSKSGVSQGLHGVIYPDGSTWANANEVIYVQISKMSEHQTLEQFIDIDLSKFRENSQNLKVEHADKITISSGQVAEVLYLTGDKWGNYEAVAYASKGLNVAMYILSCKSKEGFAKRLADFEKMVSKGFLVNVSFKK